MLGSAGEEGRQAWLLEVDVLALGASQIRDGLVVKRLAQAVREVAEVLPEGGGKGVSFRLEHQSLLAILVEGMVYGHRTAVGG